MRVLLDENLPTGLKFSAQFDVWTVREMNWLGTKNGELLTKAVERHFDVMITADRNMYFQQNLRELRIAVLVVPTNRGRTLEQIIPAIEESLRLVHVGQFAVMDLGKSYDTWPTSKLHSIEVTDDLAKHIFRDGYNGQIEIKGSPPPRSRGR